MFAFFRPVTTQSNESRCSSMPLPFLTRDASWMRFMARAALGGWLLPLLFAVFASFTATPAQAQAPVQTVVVLDFAVSSGLDPLLGRKAADGLAVELQRSGDYEVVTRQRVEEAVGQQAGLQPPFNDTAQIRLAQAVGARSVFSGRVDAISVTPGRAARVRLEAKQLDASTGDYINGTQVLESTEQKLQDIANEILVDEAINKAVFAAVRSMKQTNLPEGSVLNTTKEDVELSIGTRNGVSPGQRYTILRDVFNRARQITERVKIGELRIARVESDQSVGVLSAGGAAGVRTGDRIRQIFVATNYPTTSLSANSGSATPVTAPPARLGNTEGGVKGLVQKSSRGALGLLALVGLVGLAGLGGGGSGSSSSPRVDQPQLRNPNALYPEASLTFTSGFTGIGAGLQGESVVGYLIYRGTSPSFSASIDNLQSFIDGTNDSSNRRISYSDPPVVTGRRVTITSQNGTGNNNNQNGRVVVSDSLTAIGTDTITETAQTITLNFTQRPMVIGQTYYYRIGRVTAERVRETTTGTGGGNGTSTVRLLPVRSRVSGATGGFTALVKPQIIRDVQQYNTSDFRVRVGFDRSAYTFFVDPNGEDFARFILPLNANVTTGANQFRIQVSTSTLFSEANTFTSPDLVSPGTDANGEVVFDLDNIAIPNTGTAYIPNQTPLFLRVLSRNTEDAVPTFRVSDTVPIGPTPGGPVTGSSAASRFIASPSSGRGRGIKIGRPGSGSLSGASRGSSAPIRVLRPR